MFNLSIYAMGKTQMAMTPAAITVAMREAKESSRLTKFLFDHRGELMDLARWEKRPTEERLAIWRNMPAGHKRRMIRYWQLRRDAQAGIYNRGKYELV